MNGLGSILFVIAVVSPSSQYAAPLDLGSGLVAHYPFDGNADDVSGNMRHGVVQGAVLAPDRHGNPLSAYSFDGIDDFIEADASGLPTAERTVALWFFANNVDQPVVLSYGAGCGTSWFMALNGVDPARSYAEQYYVTSHCDVNTLGYAYPVPPVGRWIHWAVTTSPAPEGTRLYVDGWLRVSNANFIENTVVDKRRMSFGVATDTAGNPPYTDVNVDFLNGLLDDVRIYDRALSPLEIFALVGASPGPSFCDGSDGALAACPCSNPGDPESGCDIAQGTGGVRMDVVAQETSPQNRATVSGVGYAPAGTPGVIVIRGDSLDSASPVVFGDGLRCVSTPLVRLAGVLASGGTSLHVFGHGAVAGGGTFHYQLWFRNQPATYCTLDAFNLSNGRVLVW